MGISIDTNILVDAERVGKSIPEPVLQIETSFGETTLAVSVVVIGELIHGIYRAHDERTRVLCTQFCESVIANFTIDAITLDIIRLVGRLQGQQAARGILNRFRTYLSEQPPFITETPS